MKWKIAVSGLAFMSIAALVGMFFRSEPVKRPVICPAHIVLHADGLVEIDNRSFRDRGELRPWLVSYKQKNPDCFLSVDSDGGVPPAAIEQIAHVAQQVGFSKVGFITEPHALSH